MSANGKLNLPDELIWTRRRLKRVDSLSRLNIPDVACHSAFRLIEQAAKSKAGLFSKLERCNVRGRDSEDDLAGFRCCSQILIHKVYGPHGQALAPPLANHSVGDIYLTWLGNTRQVHLNK